MATALGRRRPEGHSNLDVFPRKQPITAREQRLDEDVIWHLARSGLPVFEEYGAALYLTHFDVKACKGLLECIPR